MVECSLGLIELSFNVLHRLILCSHVPSVISGLSCEEILRVLRKDKSVGSRGEPRFKNVYLILLVSGSLIQIMDLRWKSFLAA